MSNISNKYSFLAALAALLCTALPMSTHAVESADADTVFSVVTEEEGASPINEESRDSAGTVQSPVKVFSSPAEALRSDGFGLLTADTGGLPSNLWDGTSHATVTELLGYIKHGVEEPSMRELALALLLSRAEIGEAPEGKESQDLFALRVRALLAMGLAGEAMQMLEELPLAFHTSETSWLEAMILLLQKRYAEACERIQPLVARYDELRWQEALIFCQANTGNLDKAELGIELLRERNQLPEDFFMEALSVLQGKSSEPGALPDRFSLFEAALLLAVAKEPLLMQHIGKLPVLAVGELAVGEEYTASLREVAQQKLSAYALSGLPSQGERMPGLGDAPSVGISELIQIVTEDSMAVDAKKMHRLVTLAQALEIPLEVVVNKNPEASRLLASVRYEAAFPSPLLVERLREASQTGRVGETALLVLLMVGEQKVRELNDYSLSEAIVALRLVGLKRSAETLARDAVMALEWKDDGR